MATAEQALARVMRLYDILSKRRKDIEKQFRYFKGEHPLAYATPQWREFHENRYKGFSDNWCGVVGQAPVDRLRVDGFRLGEDRTSEERTLWDDWKRNELELASKQGFLASTIAKRSATLVWGDDNDEPVVTWEHPEQFVIGYTANGRDPIDNLKVWTQDDTEYATYYTADEVWKFQRPTYMARDGRTESGILVSTSSSQALGIGGWQPRQPSTDDTWPLPNPLGEPPMVEWLNRPLLGGEPLSDIEGTMAMQDAINMLWAYMFTAADYASMPARVVTNAEPPKIPVLDSEGQVIGSKAAKLEDLAQGRLLFLPGVGNQARIDQWEAARLDVFDKEIATALAHVAAQTSTPGHYLLTNDAMANLNGDALTAAEVPLATKVDNAAAFYNPSARRTLRLMAKVRGEDTLAESLRIAEMLWKDSAMHSLSQVADAATKDRAVGLSLRTVLEERYGMDPDRVEEELRRVRDEQTDPILSQILKTTQSGNADAAAGA